MKTMIAVMIMAVAATVTAQQTNTLDTYRRSYETQQQAVLARYGKALDAVMADLKQKGDLDNVLILQAEEKRFDAEKTVPAPIDAKDSFRPASESYYQGMAALLRQYVKALDEVIKKDVVADRIEEAKVIKIEKEKATFMLADIETKLPAKAVAEKPRTNKEEKPVASQSTLLSKGSLREVDKTEPREEDATAVIYCDDGCDVYHNGDKVSYAQGKELNMTIREGDVIAVKAWDTQGGTACGLVVGIKLVSNGKTIGTDTSWIYSSKEENGWEEQKFDDKGWRRTQRSNLESINETADMAFRGWKEKPRPIWGKGSPVFIRKHISLNDFR